MALPENIPTTKERSVDIPKVETAKPASATGQVLNFIKEYRLPLGLAAGLSASAALGSCLLDTGPYEDETGGSGGATSTETTGSGGTGGSKTTSTTQVGGGGGETTSSSSSSTSTSTSSEMPDAGPDDADASDGSTETADIVIDNTNQQGKVVVVRVDANDGISKAVPGLSTPDGAWIDGTQAAGKIITLPSASLQANDTVMYVCLPPCDMKFETTSTVINPHRVNVVQAGAGFDQTPPSQDAIIQIELNNPNWMNATDKDASLYGYQYSVSADADAGVGDQVNAYYTVKQ